MAEIPLFPKAILFLFLVAFFQVSCATSKPTDIDNIHLPIDRVPETFLYVVETKLGSQLHPVKLVMDTGSGLIWTQCKPCIKCFRQKVPIYDSQTSTSYHKLPCTHELCQGDNRRYKCYNNECVYNIRYGVASRPNSPRTKGVASFESFQFPVDNVHTRVIDDMIFGCSFDNQNFDFSNGQISGILGLSLAPDALASQLAKKDIIDHRFSYCLVPFHDEFVRPSVPKTQGSGGCLIDQNTLGRNAYKEVMAAFQAYYDSRNFQRMGKVVESLPVLP
ncbi:hypothetical protein CRYUN_Cryun11dG0022500 [Craigia yunnanensis]